MPMTAPIILTLLRIALIPVLVIFFYLPYGWSNVASVIVFVSAAITDWLDGYIARKTGPPVTPPLLSFVTQISQSIVWPTLMVVSGWQSFAIEPSIVNSGVV